MSMDMSCRFRRKISRPTAGWRQKAGKIWRDHGALEYRECVGDDLNVKWGIPFPRQIKLKPGETVVFAWIIFSSRAHRDRVNAKAIKDPRLG